MHYFFTIVLLLLELRHGSTDKQKKPQSHINMKRIFKKKDAKRIPNAKIKIKCRIGESNLLFVIKFLTGKSSRSDAWLFQTYTYMYTRHNSFHFFFFEITFSMQKSLIIVNFTHCHLHYTCNTHTQSSVYLKFKFIKPRNLCDPYSHKSRIS